MHDGEHNIPGIKMNAAVKASVRPIRRVLSMTEEVLLGIIDLTSPFFYSFFCFSVLATWDTLSNVHFLLGHNERLSVLFLG